VVLAQGVVDLAEAVEREHQQRQWARFCHLRRERLLQPLHEQRSVRQPRERVVEAHAPDRLLGALLLGDVADEAAHELRPACGVGQYPTLVVPPQHALLAIEDAVLGDEGRAARAAVAELAQHTLAILGMQALGPGAWLGDPLGRLEARHRPQLRADVGRAADRVGPRHVGERRDLLDQQPVAVLGTLGRPLACLRRLRTPRLLPLALERGAQPIQAGAAQAVRGARPHQRDELRLGVLIRVHDDGDATRLGAHQLEHPVRPEVRGHPPREDQVPRAGSQLTQQLGLVAGDPDAGLVAAGLLERGEHVHEAGLGLVHDEGTQQLAQAPASLPYEIRSVIIRSRRRSPPSSGARRSGMKAWIDSGAACR
jgi:hypothetical protein